MPRRLLILLWPLALVFVPVWLGNLFLSGENLLWNPIAIALAWPEGLAQLFAYSASLCTGAVFTLGLCLYWYVRWPSPLYAILLFFAATMASPAWVVVARLWHALGLFLLAVPASSVWADGLTLVRFRATFLALLTLSILLSLQLPYAIVNTLLPLVRGRKEGA